MEIQKGAKIGDHCKISSHTFICEGVTIESDVFVGHGVTFINDRYPQATDAGGRPQTEADWVCQSTMVKRGASIGSGRLIRCTEASDRGHKLQRHGDLAHHFTPGSGAEGSLHRPASSAL